MIYPGSRVRVGFEFDWGDLGYDPSGNEANLVNIIRANLDNFLNDGVTFSDVRITVDPLPTWYSSGYVTNEATTRTELPDANVFGDMAQYGIETYLPIIKWTRRDATLIDYAAPAPAPTTPNVRPRPDAPSNDGGYIGVTGSPPPAPYQPPPKPKDKGINTTWLLLGFGLLAIVAISSRD